MLHFTLEWGPVGKAFDKARESQQQCWNCAVLELARLNEGSQNGWLRVGVDFSCQEMDWQSSF